MTPSGYVATISGFIAAFPIFNQVDIGINFSILWPLIAAAPLFCTEWKLRGECFPVIGFLTVIVLKFLLFLNFEASFRYVIYIVFLFSAGALDKNFFDRFFKGFESGVLINFIFAIFQMIGMLTGRWQGTFDVRLWNSTLWHANPPGGLIWEIPRVSGFSNEPAYLGILVLTLFAYRVFVSGWSPTKGWYGLYIFCFVFFLINSRTAAVAYVWILACSFIFMISSDRLRTAAAVSIYVLSFIILPLIIMIKTAETQDLMELLLEDVSIFARTVPLLWIRDGNNLGFFDYLIGVGQYRTFVYGVHVDQNIFDVLNLQAATRDSKSLGGAYFYDFGIIGTVVFALILFLRCRRSNPALLLFSSANIIFFNVFAFSWPLFWIVVVCCLKILQVKACVIPRARDGDL
jgi:hypothetical protein